MRRHPNPWVFGPAVVGGTLSGAIAYALSSCDGFCGSGLAAALVFGSLTAVGFGTVAVLAIRSIGEWRDATEKGSTPPEVGCEQPQDD